MKFSIKSDVTGKIYSGEDIDKLINTVKAEDEAFKKAKSEQEAKAKEVAESGKTKKELAKAVELANSKLNDAHKYYDEIKAKAKTEITKSNEEINQFLTKAREEAKKMLIESNQKIAEMLKPAEQAVTKAEEEKYEAIRIFTEKFGPYQVSYTGDKAKEEWERMQKQAEDIFNAFRLNTFPVFPHLF